jgi:glycosyltransferase involved in cell wall biosynthesis
MNEKKPKLSVGLAVYNGDNFLERAIQSILSQTYTDFELILSDNASTDRTEEICRKYAAHDQRVRYHRNVVNIGGANNENQTFNMARGEYFRLAAHDDYCAPTLFEKCMEILEKNPDVVLVHSKVIAVDENDEKMGTMESEEGTESRPFARFRALTSKRHKCEATYGIIRSSVMAKTKLQMNYTGSDRAFLCELGLHGRFIQLPDHLFYKRFHAKNRFVDWRGRMAWFDPKIAREGRITFPSWQDFGNHFDIIHRSPISLGEKILCDLWMIPWLFSNGGRLIKDLTTAVYMLLHNQQWRQKKYDSTNNWS